MIDTMRSCYQHRTKRLDDNKNRETYDWNNKIREIIAAGIEAI